MNNKEKEIDSFFGERSAFRDEIFQILEEVIKKEGTEKKDKQQEKVNLSDFFNDIKGE